MGNKRGGKREGAGRPVSLVKKIIYRLALDKTKVDKIKELKLTKYLNQRIDELIDEILKNTPF
jgi:hypothetical protein